MAKISVSQGATNDLLEPGQLYAAEKSEPETDYRSEQKSVERDPAGIDPQLRPELAGVEEEERDQEEGADRWRGSNFSASSDSTAKSEQKKQVEDQPTAHTAVDHSNKDRKDSSTVPSTAGQKSSSLRK